MWLTSIEVQASSDIKADDRRALFAAILDELHALAKGVYCYGDLGTGVVTLCLAVDDDDLNSAVCNAVSLARTAIHAAGGATPDWPHCEDLEPIETADGVIDVLFAGSSQRPLVNA